MRHLHFRPLFRLVLVRALCALLCSCAPMSAVKPEAVAQVWPPAPEPARIAWVRSFSGPEELGITRSFLQKLRDLIFGGLDVHMTRPMAVVALNQVIYVADPGAKGVHRFDTASGDYRLLQAPDGSALSSPVGLARCGEEILASDSGRGELFSIGARDGIVRAITLDTKLIQPTGIACDEAHGRVFVSDTAVHQVRVFKRVANRLVFEKSIGQRGTGTGEFNFPTYLWRSAEGRLYVSDALNFRIQAFDPDGRSLGQFGRMGEGSGEAARQKGVATDSHGHVYVVDALFHAFQIFDSKGEFLLSVGARGGDPGEFWLPTGIFIDRDLIYVADSYNGRVQVFRFLGGA